MREIKFRAWSPYWKPAFLDGEAEAAMEYFELGDLSGGYTPSADIGINENDVVIMQFTGLHDKNGREIYEGDIVMKKFFNSIPCQRTFPVVIPDIYYVWQTMQDEEWEVIGNIYEGLTNTGK